MRNSLSGLGGIKNNIKNGYYIFNIDLLYAISWEE